MSSQYFRFSAHGASPQRAALLERLVARAEDSRAARDWRADAFRIVAPPATAMPGVAAATVCAAGLELNGNWVCVATAVRYIAESASVRLPQDGILSLDAGTLELLATDFNRVWNGSGITMLTSRDAQLYCVIDQALNVSTQDPENLLGQPIEEYLPGGPHAAKLRQLMSEIEMWLFEHRVNRARALQGLAEISGLWLWGGGSPLASLPSLQGWVAGDDPYFNAWRGMPADPTASGVLRIADNPGSVSWQASEARWLTPALAQLRSGKLSQLELSAGDRSYRLTRRGLRRFWRSSKPWWESFA